MKVKNLTVTNHILTVNWMDDSYSEFPTIWLRDNCPSGLHPNTNERLTDLLEIDDKPVLISAELIGKFK